MFFRLLVPLCGVHASRVISDISLNQTNELHGDVVRHNEEAFLEDVDGGLLKPLLELVDGKTADLKFRTPAEPVLVSGEVVEMAFHDGYKDWLLFTNWRYVIVDGDRLTGTVIIRSKLWQKVMRQQHFVKISTASSALDRDVEIQILGNGYIEYCDSIKGMPSANRAIMIAQMIALGKITPPTTFEFSKSIGNKGLLDISVYLDNKIKKLGMQAKPQICSDLGERNGHPAIGLCQQGWQKLASFAWKLSNLRLPSIGIVKETTDSIDTLLGDFSALIGKDETVMYKFLETWGRKDAMIVTDKQIITADLSSMNQKSYVRYPYPNGLSIDEMWPYLEEWEMETPKPVAGSGRLSATWTGPSEVSKDVAQGGFKYEFSFDKSGVPIPALYGYHSLLQQKLAASHKIR